MARNQIIVNCPMNTWTQLTNDDVTAMTFQVRKGFVEIRFTTDTTTPGASDKGYVYGAPDGQVLSAMSDLTALASAARAWARPCGGDDADVFVDHA